MKIEMKNYRGVASASLTMAPIALIAGVNGAGKSSIAQGIAASLTKNAAPIAGIAKNAAGQLLRDGAKRGSCTVGDDTGNVTANWPGASISEEGTAPYASEIACGLISLVDMKPKDAAALLITAIEAAPTFNDLKAALPKVEAPMLQQVWQAIQTDGWDVAHKRSQERGAKLKGGWEHVTGEKYGSSKAEGWQHDLVKDQDLTAEGLTTELAELKRELETALQNQAVGAANIAHWEKQVHDAATARESMATVKAAQDKLSVSISELQAKTQALPRPETPEALVECPHCKGHLVVVSRSEVRAPVEGVSPEENAKRQQAIAEAQQQELTLSSEWSQHETNRRSLMNTISAGDAAKKSLSEKSGGNVTPEQLNELRTNIAEAEADLAAVNAGAQAASYHRQIQQNQLVIDALAPDGIRNKVLAQKMGTFNATLARLSGTAGWAPVAITADLSVTLGGRPYILLSESEKYRARVTLQLALSDLDGSDVVIVDAADILDRTGRNGLFKMLHTSGMRALVCMTMNLLADVPDLAKAGFGASYWLTENTLAPIGAQ